MYSVQQRLALATEPIVGAAWQWACMLRCATPGIVVSFDPVKQTCVVQPAIMEEVLLPPPGLPPFADGTPNTTQNIPTKVAIAPIQDVPIIMMRVPGWSITLPIVPGTECLLIFADSCIDGWWQSSGVQPQFDRRRHDLSDAFALFGPWSQQKLLTDYSTTSMQIRSDDQTVIIDLSTDGVTITAPLVSIQQNTSGVPLALVNDNWFQWYKNHIQPFLVGLGYIGPIMPINSETTVLEAQ
jgi:hypothetical protein